MASATVRPNPSARLFCTTTSARRWSALTTRAFSSPSSIGKHARWTRARTSPPRPRSLPPPPPPPPLERVDDEGVLVPVLHRQARQVDARPDVRVELVASGAGLFQDGAALGVVVDRRDRRPREHEVRTG